MATEDLTVWGIHAGKTGEASRLFAEQSVVALGWAKMGDLLALSPDREAFKARMLKAYPETKAGAVPVNAGQLFRFVHELEIGDIIVYPSKHDRQVNIARVNGPYEHRSELGPTYPHRREVEWITHVPRSSFTQGALYAIGSAMSLFQVKNYADEFLAALEGEVRPKPPGEDETLPYVVEDIAENTRDFILKQLAQELKGHPFEGFVAHLLEAMGYRTRVSPEGTDGGVDIIAHRDELGFEPPIIKAQVKSTEGSVGDPVTSALYGKVAGEEFGLLVTLGTFTRQAVAFAEGKSNLRLIDGTELVSMVLLHYEQLDSRYKGLIPLKRVYVPEAIEESEE